MAIAFFSMHTLTHIDTNIAISGVQTVGNTPDVGSPQMSLGSFHPSHVTGGKSLGFLALFSSTIK